METMWNNLNARVQQHSRILLLVLIGAAGLLYLRMFPTFEVGGFYDDALYIVLARALGQGEGFRRIELITAPLTTFVPPGYPLLLMPLVTAFPHNLDVPRLTTVLFALGNLPLLWLFAKRRLPSLLALLVVTLYAFQPAVVFMVPLVMTEAAFVFFTLLALLLLERYEGSPSAWNASGLALIVLAGMTYFVRVPGLVFVSAVFLYLVLRKRWRHAFVFGAGVGLLIGAWFVRNWLVAGVFLSQEYARQATRSGADGFAQQVLLTLYDYSSLLPNVIAPILSPKVLAALNQVTPVVPLLIGLSIIAIMLIGALSRTRTKLEASDFYVALTLYLLLGFGRAQPRYLVPLTPFLYIYFLVGLGWLAGRVLRARRVESKIFVAVCAILLLLLNFARDAQQIIDPARNHIPDVSLGAIWLNDHTPADAIVMSGTPRSTWLYAQRQMVPFPHGMDNPRETDAQYVYTTLPDHFAGTLVEWAIESFPVDYVLVAPPLQVVDQPNAFELDEYALTEVLPVMQSNPSRYQLVYRMQARNVYVYKVINGQ